MQKILVLLLSFYFSPAFAGALLDARLDHVSRSGNETSGIKPSQAFQVQRARVWVKGNIGELNSFTARFNMLAPAETASNAKKIRDNSSNFSDLLYLTRKLNENYSLSFGKLYLGMGGIEGAQSAADVYLVSEGGRLASVDYTGAIALEAKWEDHNLKLAVGNLSEDVTDVPATSPTRQLQQTRNIIGFNYFAKLYDNWLQPNVSFYTEKFESAVDSVTKTNSYLALGTRLKWEILTLEFDYLLNSYAADPALGAGSNRSTNSMLGLIRYHLEGASSVHLKIEQSSKKVYDSSGGTEAGDKVNAYTLAYEYKPLAEENWRAHLALTRKEKKPAATDMSMEQNLFLGMRMMADFTK